MADKQMEQFDLSKLPITDAAKQQVQAVKDSDQRLSNAMATIEPEDKGEKFKATVFEAPNFKVNMLGKVFGANIKGKF